MDTKTLTRFREFIFKMRGGIWTLLFLIILLLTNHKPELITIIFALIIIFAGQLIRFWAAGTIGLYRGEKVKAQRLATTGAYSLIRNPLFFGNALIGLGWSLIAGYSAIIIFVISFWIIYAKIIIPFEEKFLTEKFGLEYLHWKNKTGMFFPKSLKNFRKGVFDRKILIRSEIHSLITTIIGTVIILVKALCYT